MARKPLPLGGYGNIRLYGRVDGKWTPKSKIAAGTRLGQWRAITNYRGYDGVTRPVERSGTSISDATDRLREHLANLNGARALATVMSATSSDGSDSATITSADRYLRTLLPHLTPGRPLTKNSRVIEGVPAYLARIKDECAPTTVDRHVSALRTHIVPGLGQLLFVECSVNQLQQFDAELLSKRLAKKGSKPRKLAPHTRRVMREVVRGLLQVAVEAEILQHNPVASMRRIKGGAQTPAKAIPAETLAKFFADVDADKRAVANDLPNIIRTLFGLGTRIGETLALTWRYINLADKPIRRTVFAGTPNEQTRVIPPHYVWVNATISEPLGLPVQRTPVKTRRSNRVIPIPDFLFLMLTLARPADARLDEPVFVNPGPGPWRSPHLVGEQLRSLRGRIGMPDFKSHAGRKTASTVLYNSGFRDTDLSDQFGHASGDFTRTNYVEPAPAKREAAEVLDRAFGGRFEE